MSVVQILQYIDIMKILLVQVHVVSGGLKVVSVLNCGRYRSHFLY